MSVDTPDLNHSLYTSSQVRELDRLAIEVHRIPGPELMERAGKAAWTLLMQTWPQAERIVVVCGAGNNAGDGYVLARLAVENGKGVELLTLTPPDNLKGDALAAAKKYLEGGQSATPFSESKLSGADVLVDAIFGTGLDRGVTGEYLAAITAINRAGVPVLSIDIPSGLNADTGKVMGVAVHADTTISFIGRKQGLYTGESAEFRGSLEFSDLGIPLQINQSIRPSAQLIDLESCKYLLPRRSRIAHKGHYGHVLIVGGDYGFAGSVRMSAEAAARTGAGLVSIATRPGNAVSIPAARPELMAAGVEHAGDLGPLLERATVVAVGPGLGQSDWAMDLFSRVLDTKLPLVIDADGLNLLAQDPVKRDNWILTPHPGEASRLLGCSVPDVESDRFRASLTLHQKYGGTVILKGSGTIVIDGAGNYGICAGGNPGMASGGMGDVLTGVIAGLSAQGINRDEAAKLGVCIHARAADMESAVQGERGLLATDLLPWIRQLVNP